MTEQDKTMTQTPALPGATDTPAAVARQQWQAAGARRRWIAYTLVALVSVGAGVGGTVLVVGQQKPRHDPAPATTATTGQHAGHAAAPDAAAPPRPEGATTQAVYIAPIRQQLIGVRTAQLEHKTLGSSIKTVGILAYDETRVTEIHTKVAGWIDRVFVDFVGKQVTRGQPLLTVYSPDLVATQREYLLSLKAQRQLGTSQFAETRDGAINLLAAARERLKLWDITDAQIAELERTGQARRLVTLFSPFTGVVLERNTFAGQYLTPDMAAVKIADLSTIWAVGEIFEYELGRVAIGQAASVEFPHGTGTRTLTGRITFVYPDINPETRRARVRIEFRNPGLALKPGTYVTVRIEAPGGFELALPSEALIDTGEKQYAIVALGNGYFEPREVKVGAAIGDQYPVLEGLQHGDTVVTSAQFLIDSETNLKAAMQSMVGHGHSMEGTGSDAAPAGPAAPQGGHSGHQAAAAPSDHSSHKQ